jgi:predicted permease
MVEQLDYFRHRPAGETRGSGFTTLSWYLVALPAAFVLAALLLNSSEIAGVAMVSALVTCPLGVASAIASLRRPGDQRAAAITALVFNVSGAALVWCGLAYVIAYD